VRLRPTKRRALSPQEVWAREEARAKRTALEDRLDMHIRSCGLPTPEKELRFHPEKGWRFDRAWPAFMVAIEVEGIPREGFGRHQYRAGFEADALKCAEAQRLGWKVLRVTGKMIKSAYAIRLIQETLEKAGWGHVR
jgi:very-short-patch-repair endonuclease